MAKKKTKSKSKTSNSKVVSTPDFDAINKEAITSATTSVNQLILKVCRLCESKDGPFHNIFDSEKVTAKKIEELMPFWVRLKKLCSQITIYFIHKMYHLRMERPT